MSEHRDQPDESATSEDHDPWAFMDRPVDQPIDQPTAPYATAPPPATPPAAPPDGAPRDPATASTPRPEPAPEQAPEPPPATWATGSAAAPPPPPSTSAPSSAPYWSPSAGAPGSYGPAPHPTAGTAMVLSLVGLIGGLLCAGLPLVLSPFAWRMGSKAVRDIDADPRRWSGREQAMTAKVCGIIGTVLLVLGLLVLVVILAVFVAAVRDVVSDPSPVPATPARV